MSLWQTFCSKTASARCADRRRPSRHATTDGQSHRARLACAARRASWPHPHPHGGCRQFLFLLQPRSSEAHLGCKLTIVLALVSIKNPRGIIGSGKALWKILQSAETDQSCVPSERQPRSGFCLNMSSGKPEPKLNHRRTSSFDNRRPESPILSACGKTELLLCRARQVSGGSSTTPGGCAEQPASGEFKSLSTGMDTSISDAVSSAVQQG